MPFIDDDAVTQTQQLAHIVEQIDSLKEFRSELKGKADQSSVTSTLYVALGGMGLAIVAIVVDIILSLLR